VWREFFLHNDGKMHIDLRVNFLPMAVAQFGALGVFRDESAG
jgi:hypothetical protein